MLVVLLSPFARSGLGSKEMASRPPASPPRQAGHASQRTSTCRSSLGDPTETPPHLYPDAPSSHLNARTDRPEVGEAEDRTLEDTQSSSFDPGPRDQASEHDEDLVTKLPRPRDQDFGHEEGVAPSDRKARPCTPHQLVQDMKLYKHVVRVVEGFILRAFTLKHRHPTHLHSLAPHTQTLSCPALDRARTGPRPGSSEWYVCFTWSEPAPRLLLRRRPTAASVTLPTGDGGGGDEALQLPGETLTTDRSNEQSNQRSNPRPREPDRCYGPYGGGGGGGRRVRSLVRLLRRLLLLHCPPCLSSSRPPPAPSPSLSPSPQGTAAAAAAKGAGDDETGADEVGREWGGGGRGVFWGELGGGSRVMGATGGVEHWAEGAEQQQQHHPSVQRERTSPQHEPDAAHASPPKRPRAATDDAEAASNAEAAASPDIAHAAASPPKRPRAATEDTEAASNGEAAASPDVAQAAPAPLKCQRDTRLPLPPPPPPPQVCDLFLARMLGRGGCWWASSQGCAPEGAAEDGLEVWGGGSRACGVCGRWCAPVSRRTWRGCAGGMRLFRVCVPEWVCRRALEGVCTRGWI